MQANFLRKKMWKKKPRYGEYADKMGRRSQNFVAGYHRLHQKRFRAASVKQTILCTIREIPLHPERYPVDKFKKGNNGNYRAFEIYHIRIAYKTETNAIKIIRIRNTWQESLEY